MNEYAKKLMKIAQTRQIPVGAEVKYELSDGRISTGTVVSQDDPSLLKIEVNGKVGRTGRLSVIL